MKALILLIILVLIVVPSVYAHPYLHHIKAAEDYPFVRLIGGDIGTNYNDGTKVSESYLKYYLHKNNIKTEVVTVKLFEKLFAEELFSEQWYWANFISILSGAIVAIMVPVIYLSSREDKSELLN